jgi:uncharacterized protein YjlB
MKDEALTHYFKDDGLIPNSPLPLVIYKGVFVERDRRGARWLEHRFGSHNWSNAWRGGVFQFHHYHSITHEVIGVYQGESILQFGGDGGESIYVQAGDVIVIPAGVAHKNLGSNVGFQVVGAYPNGMDYDIKRDDPRDYREAIHNLTLVQPPDKDPLFGEQGGVSRFWLLEQSRG